MTAFVGRQQERLLLRNALEDRAPRLLVVRGPSGVGKTALIENALHDLALPGPILGRAKYAEQSTTAGLRPVVEALSQAVDAALGRLYDPAAGTASLRSLVGTQYDALLAAGFGAAGLTGSTMPSPAAALLSREGTTRLVDAVARVLQWLDGFALPVVLFIDDWHRAPNEALGFVHACSRRNSGSSLKLVLAARSEGTTAYPETASIVELQPLANADQLELLTRLLGEPAEAQAVIDWLGDHASGLPFDLAEIALALRRERAFAGAGTSIHVDPARAIAIDHRDIDRIIFQRAQTLPRAVLRLGTAVALWGDSADLDALSRCLSEPRRVTQTAAEALQSNGFLRLKGDEVTFPHDRIRATFLQIPQRTELQALAHAMADSLLNDGAKAHRQTALRLKLVGGLDDAQDSRLAGLFATEAEAARVATQFDLAADFAEAAWSIFRRPASLDSGDRRAVLREACLAAAHRRQAEATRERCALMIASAANTAELANAYEWSVVATRLAGTAADAWELCREGLARFGVRLPTRISRLHLLAAALLWKLVGRRARRLIAHDALTERALTSFANTAGTTVWERDPRYTAYVSLRWATRARLMGYNSAYWLSIDAFICSAMKDYRAAAEFGDKAMAVLAQLDVMRGMTVYRAICFGQVWRDSRASLIDGNRQCYDLCIAEGDLIGAAYSVRNDTLWAWRTAQTLEEVVARFADNDAKADRLGDATTHAEIVRLAELVRRLRQPEPLSSRLPDEFVRGKFVDPPLPVLEYLSLAQDWPAILSLADEFRAKRPTLDSHAGGINWRFYENLARLKTGLPPSRSDLRFIERSAKVNPTDQLGKLLLLRAEQSYRRGEKDCLRLFGEALEAMQKASFRLEGGLAAECAAAAARDLGDNAAYERFSAAAASIWSGWGAFAKLAEYGAGQLDESVRARLAEAEAQAAMAKRGERAKSRFLAEIGHELRTPLQAMQGLLDLAAERPEQLDLGEVREVFGSLKSVVDDLTELGALGAEAPLNVRATGLAALLNSELHLVAATARQKGLALHSDIATLDGHFFAIDPDRVRQVVRNLISNAIKYTEKGGIALRASATENPDGEVHITLAVEDTGPGIPEERLPHLFEPFDRAGLQDSRGLGLGLSLSRRIAERMNGSLVAERRPEGGSRFVFSFAAARRGAPSDPLIASRPLTILIVEDTTLVRRLMSQLLAIDGHRVIGAENIARGLEQAHRHTLDLVLLDLHLPDGDGLSLLGKWPPDRALPPVIVLTAAVSRETEERVNSAGAAILRKPIAALDLRIAIAQACGGSESPTTSSGFDTEMAKLAREAREEIAKRADELAELVRSNGLPGEIRVHAHKLAGLAAQFDAPRIAEAADRIEQACANGTSPKHWLADLEIAGA